MTRAAILLVTGYTQPAHRTDGCGLWTIYDRLRERFHDRRDWWVSIRPWNAKLEHDADEIVRLQARRIVTVSYSWGCGKGLPRFAKRLKEQGRSISLACLIDPVPYRVARWASTALMKGDSPFMLPENTCSFASWRTVNKPTWTTPWGRDVASAVGAKPLHRRAFGSAESLEKYKPLGEPTVDGSVIHGNIDDNDTVHSEACSLIERFLTNVEGT